MARTRICLNVTIPRKLSDDIDAERERVVDRYGERPTRSAFVTELLLLGLEHCNELFHVEH